MCFRLALKLAQRAMQQLKNERVRIGASNPCASPAMKLTSAMPDYDWLGLWRPLLSLAAFIASKIDELARHLAPRLDELVAQVRAVVAR